MSLLFSKTNISNVLFFQITCLCWFMMKIISWKVWTQDRLFPTMPFWEWTTSPEISWILYGISMGLLAYFSFFKPKSILIVLFLISELGQLLLDQMRWQPWEYQFLLITIFFISFRNAGNFKLLLFLLLGFTYIFSGLHKFNEGFLELVWGNLILKRFFGIQYLWKQHDWLFFLGYVIPITEALLGILLLVMKNKKWPIVLLMGMHLGILFMLSPLGVNYNAVVWPWNFLMFLLLGFIYKDHFHYSFHFSFFKKVYVQFVLILVLVLPISNFFGFWDNYLSFSLYSGKTPNICICFNQNEETKLLEPYISKTKKNNFCNNQTAIFMNKWALAELKVPIYSEKRTLEYLEKKMATDYPNTNFEWNYITPDYSLKLRRQKP